MELHLTACVVNLHMRTVERGNKVFRLTSRETKLLDYLAQHPRVPFADHHLLEKVWGYELFPSTRTIDNFIVRLRKRFERDPENSVYFETVRGVGYRFTPELEEPR